MGIFGAMQRNRLFHTGLIALAVLALAGCKAQSRVQAKYMGHESDCRSIAQDKAAEAHEQAQQAGQEPQDMAYLLGNAFSECMHNEGWKVSTPKAPGDNGTVVAGPPLGAPGPGGTVAAKILPVKEPVLVVPSRAVPKPSQVTPAAPIIGPGVQPAPAPASAETIRQVTPQGGASVYQPARGGLSDAPAFGSGAGRNY